MAQKFFSALGLARKVLGLGVLGLKYNVLGLKMVVSDHSNCPDIKYHNYSTLGRISGLNKSLKIHKSAVVRFARNSILVAQYRNLNRLSH